MNRSSEYASRNAHSRLRSTFRPGRDADVIPLRSRRGHPSAGPLAGFVVLAIAAWISIAATLALLARSGREVIGQLAPGWPWW